MLKKFVSVIAGAIMGASLLTGCAGPSGEGPSQRTAILGGTGAAIGAAIGARQGGVGGALAGAVIGGAAGLVVGAILDDIERQQLRQMTVVAVRTGQPTVRTFRNTQGQTVRARTTVRTFRNTEGRSCRSIRSSVERAGGAAQDAGSREVCQVRVGNRDEWPAVE
jgi:surface antigen